MKYIQLWSLVLISCTSTFAQDQHIVDSLLQVVASDGDEKKKVGACIHLASLYQDSMIIAQYAYEAIEIANAIDYIAGKIDALHHLERINLNKGRLDEAKKGYQQIMALSERHDYARGMATGSHGLGIVAIHQGNYEQAIELLKSSIDYNKSIGADANAGDRKAVGSSYNALGVIHRRIGDSQKALYFYFKAIEIFTETNEKNGLTQCYNNIGIIYKNEGNYEEALNFHLKSLELFESLGNNRGMASNYNNIGNIHLDQQNYDRALEHYLMALKIREEMEDKSGIATAFANLGIVSSSQGNYEKALIYYFESTKMREELGDKNGIGANYSYIGKAYMHLGSYSNALEYLFRSVDILEEIGARAKLSDPLLWIGQTYLNLNDLTKARQYLTLALSQAKEVKLKINIRNALEQLALVESKLGNHEAAYKAHVLFKEMSDSLNNDEITKKLTLQEANYQFQQEKDSIKFANDREKILLENELDKRQLMQNIAFIGLSVTITIILIIFYYNRRLSRLNNKVINQKEALEKANSTKSKLFTIISHDLKGPLNSSIQFHHLMRERLEKVQLPEINELKKLFDVIERHSYEVLNMIESLLIWSRKEDGAMTFNPENLDILACFEHHKQMMELQAKTKNITLDYKPGSTVSALLDKNMFMTILRNLIGNAIKFTPEGGTITMSASSAKDKVIVQIEDTGVGIPETKMETLFQVGVEKVMTGTRGEKGTGLGLNLVHDFVKINKGYIHVNSEPGHGTTFVMVFPK